LVANVAYVLKPVQTLLHTSILKPDLDSLYWKFLSFFKWNLNHQTWKEKWLLYFNGGDWKWRQIMLQGQFCSSLVIECFSIFGKFWPCERKRWEKLVPTGGATNIFVMTVSNEKQTLWCLLGRVYINTLTLKSLREQWVRG